MSASVHSPGARDLVVVDTPSSPSTPADAAAVVRGEADAQRNASYADAFGRDSEFFSFTRSMQAYDRALQSTNSSIVLRPAGEFFSYLNDAAPEGASAGAAAGASVGGAATGTGAATTATTPEPAGAASATGAAVQTPATTTAPGSTTPIPAPVAGAASTPAAPAN